MKNDAVTQPISLEAGSAPALSDDVQTQRDSGGQPCQRTDAPELRSPPVETRTSQTQTVSTRRRPSAIDQPQASKPPSPGDPTQSQANEARKEIRRTTSTANNRTMSEPQNASNRSRPLTATKANLNMPLIPNSFQFTQHKIDAGGSALVKATSGGTTANASSRCGRVGRWRSRAMALWLSATMCINRRPGYLT